MMAKTHYFVGMATALLVSHPTDEKTVLIALMGGALGGVTPDIDILLASSKYHDDKYRYDALIGQFLALVTVGAALFLDYYKNFGILEMLLGINNFRLGIGAVTYLLLIITGFESKHRTFTHSCLALILFSGAVFIIMPSLGLPYAAAFLSHLCLDLCNKKRVQIFYPFGKGIYFKLCYAKGIANTCLMFLGLISTVVLVLNALFFKVF